MIRFFELCVFVITYPFVYFALNNSVRSRVIIRHKDTYLFVKPRLSKGQWDFPGGGVHKKEDPAKAGVRELYEELGITLDASDLRPVGDWSVISSRLSFRGHYYFAALKDKPDIRLQRIELADAKWINPNQTNLKVSRNALDALKRLEQAI